MARVLIVDDHQDFRKTVARFVRVLGHEPMEAAEACEAEEIVKRASERVDLVMLDVCLAGAVGTTVAETLERLRPGIPVLFMSGYGADRIDGHTAAARAFLQKPFSVDSLGDAIDRLMGQ